MPDNFIIQIEDGDKNILYALNTNKNIVIRLNHVLESQIIIDSLKELKRLSEIDRAKDLIEICQREILRRGG